MIKPFTLLAFLAFISRLCIAQTTTKTYFTEAGDRTYEKANAHSYVVMKKADADTVWAMSQYNMFDSLMTSGSYKEASMATPHGLFAYYRYVPAYYITKYNYATHSTDTSFKPNRNIKYTEGYFISGKKNGKWLEYNEDGVKETESYFINDVASGPVTIYNSRTGLLVSKGQMLNGERDGDWHTYHIGGEIMQTDHYRKGKITNTISHAGEKWFFVDAGSARPTYDMVKYLNQVLGANNMYTPGRYHVSYTLTLTKEGQLSDPRFLTTNKDIDIAIIDALLMAEKWKPGIHKHEPVDTNLRFEFEVRVGDNGKMRIETYKSLYDKIYN